MKERKKAKLFSLSYLFYDICKIIAAIPGLLAFRPKWLYMNKKAKKRIRGGAILIGNHTGYSDPIYMQYGVWYRRHHFLCAKEFFEGKARFFFKNFMCIPIDRENFGMDIFREITEHLKQGELVSMFPEGQIEKELNSFKSGMILMALQSGAPIVPIYIKPRKTVWHRLVMAIGEPVDVAEVCGGSRPSFSKIESVTELLHDMEVQLKEMCEKGDKK